MSQGCNIKRETGGDIFYQRVRFLERGIRTPTVGRKGKVPLVAFWKEVGEGKGGFVRIRGKRGERGRRVRVDETKDQPISFLSRTFSGIMGIREGERHSWFSKQRNKRARKETTNRRRREKIDTLARCLGGGTTKVVFALSGERNSKKGY